MQLIDNQMGNFESELSRLKGLSGLNNHQIALLFGLTHRNTIGNYLSGKHNLSATDKKLHIQKLMDYIADPKKYNHIVNPDAYVKNRDHSTQPIPNDIHGVALSFSVPFYELRNHPSSAMLYEILKKKPNYEILINDQRPTFAFKMWGQSMSPTIKDGDTLYSEIIRDINEIQPNSYCLIVTKESKRIRRVVVSDKKVKLICDNRSVNEEGERNYPDIEIDKNKVIEVALIVSKQSSLLP